MTKPFSIAVLISGGGTTLKNLIDHRNQGNLDAEIQLIISNNPDAAGLAYGREAHIPVRVVDHRKIKQDQFSDRIFDSIRQAGIQWVVMGGFLRRLTIPPDFENRVINIHPSLIPAFCGQGFYGRKVHQAVIDYGCKLSGCTVHFVDDQYDHGPIIAQETVAVLADDTADSLAQRVFEQECKLYPRVINAISNGNLEINRRIVEIK